MKSFFIYKAIVFTNQPTTKRKMSQTQQSSSSVEQITNALANQSLQKKKVIMPPTWFNLTKISAYEMLSQISYLTNHFRDLPQEVAQWIMYDANCRQFSSFGSIPAPPSIDLVKQIIGIDGYYLKLTTQKCLVDFIWHDRVRNEFQFWGDYQCCVKAMNAIRYRICKYVEADANKTMLSVEYVFENDVCPHPAVCLEAVVQLDVNGVYKKTLTSKRYPDSN